jgi:hypothetical protein
VFGGRVAQRGLIAALSQIRKVPLIKKTCQNNILGGIGGVHRKKPLIKGDVIEIQAETIPFL